MAGYFKIIIDSGNPNYSSDDNGLVYNKNKTTLFASPANPPSGKLTIGTLAFRQNTRLNADSPKGIIYNGPKSDWEDNSKISYNSMAFLYSGNTNYMPVHCTDGDKTFD